MSDEHFERDTLRDLLTDSKAVDWFAGRMAVKLLNNRHKAHWSEADTGYLLDRLVQEVMELRQAIDMETAEDVINECADVANFAMMIADNANHFNSSNTQHEARGLRRLPELGAFTT